MKGRTLKWVVMQPQGEPEDIVWVDLGKLDTAWSSSSDYVGSNGSGADIGGRYEKFGLWVAQGQAIEMAILGLDGEVVCFTDGRHRTAWLRDHGVAAIPVQTSPAQAAVIAQRYGSTARLSILPGRVRFV